MRDYERSRKNTTGGGDYIPSVVRDVFNAVAGGDVGMEYIIKICGCLFIFILFGLLIGGIQTIVENYNLPHDEWNCTQYSVHQQHCVQYNYTDMSK